MRRIALEARSLGEGREVGLRARIAEDDEILVLAMHRVQRAVHGERARRARHARVAALLLENQVAHAEEIEERRLSRCLRVEVAGAFGRHPGVERLVGERLAAEDWCE